MPALLKLSKNIPEKEHIIFTLLGHDCPNTKSDKDITHTKKGNSQANITDENICKNPQQNSSKQNSTMHLKDHSS